MLDNFFEIKPLEAWVDSKEGDVLFLESMLLWL